MKQDADGMNHSDISSLLPEVFFDKQLLTGIDCDNEDLSVKDLFDTDYFFEEGDLCSNEFGGGKELGLAGLGGELYGKRESIEPAKELWFSTEAVNDRPPKEGNGSKSLPQSRIRAPTTASTQTCQDLNEKRDQYYELLNKLSLSMKKSEFSRAAVMRQRNCHSTQPNIRYNKSQLYQPAPESQTVSGLSYFLSGSRSTLTPGLEQSRKQLATYMHHMTQDTM